MIKKNFDKLGVSASALGFGCMRFPVKEDGTIDESKAEALLDHAYHNGVTYFDTAWPYHSTTSEPFVGKVMKKYPRETYQMVTKMPVWLCNNREELEEYFAKQLERCCVEYFDFYLLHALSKERFEHCKKIGAFEFLADKKKEGKIRAAGFSFHDQLEHYLPIVEHFPWDFAQIQHNYIDDRFQNSRKLYDILVEHEIPCVVMEPVRGGFLSNLPEEVESIFKKANPERSISSWAIRWVADHDNIKVVLSGMTEMSQLEDNLSSLKDESYKLSDAERETVNQVVEKMLSYKTVPCTGCRYCMDCPNGVNIPGVFTNFNKFSLFQNKERAKKEYFEALAETAHGDKCISCGLCMTQCPQHINIPEELMAAHEHLKTAL